MKGGGVRRLMVDAILNFHFWFWNPSLTLWAEIYQKPTGWVGISIDSIWLHEKKIGFDTALEACFTKHNC